MKIANFSKRQKKNISYQERSKPANEQLSRKEKRRMIRKSKKQRNKAHHQKHQQYQIRQQVGPKLTSNSKKHQLPKTPILKANIKIQNKQKQGKQENKKKKAFQIDQKILQDQEQINFYEKKLGIKQKGSKYKNIMKDMGYDDDLFDFLQDISKKVNMSKQQYKPQSEVQQNSQMELEQKFQSQENDLNQNSDIILEEYQHKDNQNEVSQQLIDQIYDQNYWPEGFQPFEQGQFQQDAEPNKCKLIEQLPKLKYQVKNNTEKLFQNSNKKQAELLEIRKSLTSLFNKLSDGNIMITFRQMRQIFGNHSSSSAIPVFIQLFLKFNVEVEKPHLHILLSNIVLSAGLHQLLGNRLMAPLISQITDKFNFLQDQQEDQQQIQQIGYSKIFERGKNCVIILSYLYEFGSLTGDFILSFVKQLSKQLSKNHIEFLYLIIQKIGNKIRQNDPAILKSIIDQLKSSILNFRTKNQNANSLEFTKKIDIIQIQLNELRFNRKASTFNDQRMAFFFTFINKNIPAQINSQKQILLLTYQQIRTSPKDKTNWWDGAGINYKVQNTSQNNQHQELAQLDHQKQQLLALAKSIHLVTEVRKNIFLEIMQSQDYVQASQRLLSLKVKNMQQIGTVLVQVCILQPTFNPFYPLVASKIANIIHKFRLNIQYAVWDHIKLIDQYDLRKTSNLAKFCSRFVSNPISNGSLSILKTFTDLINVTPSATLFLKVFFKQFFKIVKKPYLAQLGQKLQEQNNRGIKQAIQQYLGEVGLRQKAFGQEQKMKILRRLLNMQKEQD